LRGSTTRHRHDLDLVVFVARAILMAGLTVGLTQGVPMTTLSSSAPEPPPPATAHAP
jgi:hypothetical protein